MDNVVIAFADVAGLLLIAWIFRLVRLNRLYVGYGVILVLATAAGVFLLSVPSALASLAPITRVTNRAAGLISLTLAFVVLMLVYLLSQLTLLSNRLTVLVQELAIRNADIARRSDPNSPELR